MKPRLKTSKKWTAFPSEYTEQIKSVFIENFGENLLDAKISVEGRIFPEEITLRVGILKSGKLAGSNFEVSTNYQASEEQDAVEKIHLCVDAAGAVMTEFFENPEEVDFPFTWKEVEFGKNKVFVQFSTENSDLEAEANKLLGISDDGILHEDEDDQDALSHAEIDEEISPSKDDDEDFEESEEADQEEANEDIDNQPRMFGGKKKIKKEDMH